MNEISLVFEQAVPERLDLFLTRHFPVATSRVRVQALIAQGKVTVNGHPAKRNQRLVAGDRVAGTFAPDEPRALPAAENIPLTIVHEDERLLVVNKPCGMVVHPACGNYEHTLVNALLHHTAHLSGMNTPVRPGIVHRLDKDTSGILVVAKDDAAHRFLAEQFKTHAITRRYLAIVSGRTEFDEETIALPLGRSFSDHRKIVVRHTPPCKEAVTHYRTLKRFETCSLVECTLHTGRTHQIRVHLSHKGYPILGDPLYGDRASFSRLALHAATLGFLHPSTESYVEFTAPLPPDLAVLTGPQASRGK